MENQNTSYHYNDDIDLRVYIKTILDRWVWIAVISIAIGAMAFFYLSLQVTSYISTALVSVSAPSLEVEFDTSIRTSEGFSTTFLNDDLATLAISDEIILNLFEQVQPSLPENIQNHFNLKGHLAASTEAQSGIIELSGNFSEPELSALVVNEWSQLFVKSANLFLEGSEEDSQQFLQAQLATTQKEREAINLELVEFQAKNRISLIQTQLDSDRNLQQIYVNRRTSLEVLLYDIRGIRNQIEQKPNDPNTLSELSLYALQNRAFGTAAGNIEIQVDSLGSLSDSTIEDRIALLDILESSIKFQQAEVEGLIASIDPLILFKQQQIQELSTAEAELESRRKLIYDTYDTVALKVAEADIEQNNMSGKALVASRAIVPVRAESKNLLANSVLASIVAAMLLVGIILIRAWWIDVERNEHSIEANAAAAGEQAVASFSNGNHNDYSIRPIGGNGNGAHPTEIEEFPAND